MRRRTHAPRRRKRDSQAWQRRRGRHSATRPTLARRRLALEPLEDRRLLAAGDLDPTFDGDGLQSTPFAVESLDDSLRSIAAQLDGKLVVVGRGNDSDQRDRFPDFAVARFNADGTLDETFGRFGQVTSDFGGPDRTQEEAYDVAIQADGKIVVVGQIASATDLDFGVARYNADGSLDATFGGGAGFVTTDLAGANDSARQVVIQPDGKIVVAGGSGAQLAVVRYGTSGALDSTFDGDGIATADLQGSRANPVELILKADGKLLVGVDQGFDYGLAQFEANGSLDAAFGNAGITTTDFGRSYDLLQDIALRSDGRIVAVGFSGTAIGLAQYNADGTLDASFSGDGLETQQVGSSPRPSSVIVQSDGNLVVAGTYDYRASLFRFDSDGTLDTTFGTNGVQPTELAHGSARIRQLLQVGTDIVGVGDVYGTLSQDGFVLRHGADGAPIGPFGDNSVSTVDFKARADAAAKTVLFQPDGKILAIGSAPEGGRGAQFALARYDADGSSDATFGVGGTVTTAIPGADQASMRTAALQADGKILVSGFVTGDGYPITVARYLPDGSPDPGFGTAGIVQTDVPGSSRVAQLLVRGDGRIVVVARSQINPASPLGAELKIVQYLADGSLDTSFGTGGMVTDLVDPSVWSVNSAVLDAAGGIVVSGHLGFGGNSPTGEDVLLVRFDAGGTLDTSFGQDGRVVTDLGSDLDRSSGLFRQADGKLLQVATRNTGEAIVVRYLADGTVDSTFDGDGIVVFETLGSRLSESTVTGITQQPDGKLLVSGTTTRLVPVGRMMVARLNADGSVDNTFGAGGISAIDFEGQSSQGEDLAVTADGKIVVVGQVNREKFGSDFAVARLLPEPDAYPPAGALRFSSFLHQVKEEDLQATITVERVGGLAGAVTVDLDTSELQAKEVDDFTAVHTTVNFADGQATAAVDIDIVDDDNLEPIEKFVVTLSNPTGGAVLENPREAMVEIDQDRFQTLALDPTFDGDGMVTTDPGGGSDVVSDMLQQDDGKLVVVGRSIEGASPFTVARYLNDGTLDPLFGTGGIATTDFSTFADWATAVGLQSDGKIVVGGNASLTGFDAALVRYDTNGALDRTFGPAEQEGRVVLPLENAMELYDLVVLDDDRILVSGMIDQPESARGLTVVRLLADGVVDTTFGQDGMITLPQLYTSVLRASSQGLVVQPDGKILVTGQRRDPGTGAITGEAVVIRLQPDGSLDPTFGAGGEAGIDAAATPTAMKLQEDGNILVTGFEGGGSAENTAVWRISPDGSPDSTFAAAGKYSLDAFPADEDRGVDIDILPDGRIIVMADVDFFIGDRAFVTVILTPGGALDPDYGLGMSFRQTRFHLGQVDGAMLIQDDGKIVLGAQEVNDAFRDDWKLIRLLGPEGPGEFRFRDAQVEVDENASVARIFVQRENGAGGAASVRLFTADDTATAGDDYTAVDQVLDFADGQAIAYVDVPIRDDATQEGPETVTLTLADPTGGAALGQPVSAVLSIIDGPGQFEFYSPLLNVNETSAAASITVRRVAGSDGAAGVTVRTSDVTALAGDDYLPVDTTLQFADRQAEQSFTVPILPDHLLEGQETLQLQLSAPTGGATLGTVDAATLRIFDLEPNRGTTAGTLDPTFGTGGIVPIGEGDPLGLVRLDDGRYVVATAGSGFAVTRTESDGLLDAGFGTAGVASADLGRRAEATGFTVLDDGSVVVVGMAIGDDAQSDFALVKYTRSGALDASFGTGGVVLTDFGNTDDRAFAVTVDNDGKIVVAGSTGGVLHRDFAVARYLPDGTPDGTFDSDGLRTLDFDGRFDEARAVAVDADGKIVVGGDSSAADRYSGDGSYLAGDIALARLLPDGTLDSTFDGDGMRLDDFLGRSDSPHHDNDHLHKLLLQDDGKLLVAGGNDGDFLLVRYNPDGSNDTSFGSVQSDNLHRVIGSFVSSGSSTTVGVDQLFDVVVQPDGRILAVGRSDDRLAMMRVLSDGRPDLLFGTSGFVSSAAGTAFSLGQAATDEMLNARGATVLPNGQIVVAGRLDDEQMALAQFLGEGACPAQGCLQFGATGAAIDERDGSITISVNRPIGMDFGTVTVDYATLDNTATAGKDYEAASGTLTFLDGQTANTITIRVLNDTLAEGHETVQLVLFNPTGGAILGGASVIPLVIEDDELDQLNLPDPEVPAAVQNQVLIVPETTVDADAFSAFVTVLRISGSGPASVDYVTVADGNAEEGQDFTPQVGTLNFNGSAGNEFRVIEIPIHDDKRIDGDETFSIHLSNPINTSILPDYDVGRVIIQDVFEPVFGVAGELDPTFAGGGETSFDIDPNDEIQTRGYQTVQLPDGKYLQVGRLGYTAGMALLRWNADGTPDTTFGGDGLVIDDAGGGTDIAYSAVPDGDGVLVLGQTYTGGNADILISRYLDDGTPDAGFGTAGRIRITPAAFTTTITKMVPTADAKLILAGRATVETLPHGDTTDRGKHDVIGLLRINRDGSIDTSFGTAGQRLLDVEDATLDELRVQSDGKILIAIDDYVLRLNADGTIDTGFAGSGQLVPPLPDVPPGLTDVTESVRMTDIHLLSDDRFFVAAYVYIDGTDPNTGRRVTVFDGTVLARYDADGNLDAAFGDNGTLEVPELGIDEFVIQGDGRFVALSGGIRVLRINPDGSRDIGFGYDGVVWTQPAGGFTSQSTFTSDGSLFLLPDGKIVVGGRDSSDSEVFELLRLRGGDAVGGFRLRMSQFVDEPEGSLLVQVERVGGTDGAAGVDLATSDIGSAVDGQDYTGVSQTFSFPDSYAIADRFREVTIPITDDLTQEGDEQFNAALSNPTGGAALYPLNSIDVTIVDDDQPGELQLESINVLADEDQGTVSIFVERINGTLGPVSVDLVVSAGTATDGQDFQAKTETVDFADGQTLGSVTVTLLDDLVYEGNETVNLQLQNPTGGAVLGFKPTGRLTIVDDEPPPPPEPLDVQFVASEFPAYEGDGERLEVVVYRRGDASAAASVDYTIGGGTALLGPDYQGVSGTLVFLPNQVAASFFIDVTDDDLVEGGETIDLALSNPLGVPLGELDTATVLIVDNDEAAIDYGDAPDPVGSTDGDYPTLLASDGARHVVVSGFSLGDSVDDEADGQPSGGADADADDGVTGFSTPWVVGDSAQVTVTVHLPAETPYGLLNAWVDFNGDGRWSPSEQVFHNELLIAGAHDLSIEVPDDAAVGATFARFRLSSFASLQPTGEAPDGEVEDYSVEIAAQPGFDFGDAPLAAQSGLAGDYPTLLADNGAAHEIVVGGPYLGATSPDGETDGRPTADADGDDTLDTDDEDVDGTGGILLTAGQPLVGFELDHHGGADGALLSAWIDLNADGDWDDEGEQFLTDAAVAAGPGTTPLDGITLPADAAPGTTYVRVRISTQAGLTSRGLAQDGEVEDFAVEINRPSVADAGGPYAISEGGSLGLDASASSDPDGDPLSFTWDVNGDGTFGDATGETPTLTWAQLSGLGIADDGQWTVTVRAGDGRGAPVEASTTLEVANLAPTPSISGPTTGLEGTPVSLTGSATDPAGPSDTVSLAWSVTKDGGPFTSGTGGDIQFTPDAAGNYMVTLTASDEDGGSQSVDHTVTVLPHNDEADLALTVTLLETGWFRLDVFDATPGALVTFVFGNQLGPYELTSAPLTLDVADPVFFAQAIADPSGRAMALLLNPPPEEPTYFQAYEQQPNPAISTVWVTSAGGLPEEVVLLGPEGGDTAVLVLEGTPGDDTFEFTGGPGPADWRITVNGAPRIAGPQVTAVRIQGYGGSDTVVLTGTDGAESLDLWAEGDGDGNNLIFTGVRPGGTYTVTAAGVEFVTADLGGGEDATKILDSSGDDVFTATPTTATFAPAKGNAFGYEVTGVETHYAVARFGGVDLALLYDSPGGDVFVAKPTHSKLEGPGRYTFAKSFESIHGIAGSGGDDVAYLWDSAGSDRYVVRKGYAAMVGPGYYTRANAFPTVNAYSTNGGADDAWFFGGSKADLFTGDPQNALLTNADNRFFGRGFERVYATATADGLDTAELTGSDGDDTFEIGPGSASLAGPGYEIRISRFHSVTGAAGSGGADTALVHDAVLESGRQEDGLPFDVTKLAWLHLFDDIQVEKDGDVTTLEALDEVFTAYWQ